MHDAVHTWAERALYGETLADKLAPWPARLGDAPAPAHAVPERPGRPHGLALPAGKRRVPPVHKLDLHTDSARARVLHELANHELQALELLALALLRWPDAPKAFRSGLISTLRDEQRHLGLYLDRLTTCGGHFGQSTPSRFFWDALRDASSPAAFTAGLSLCFEAANLDFCQHWGARFAEAGDQATADVLDIVYQDEIRHVRHGLHWFGKWADGDRLDAWQQALPANLTPARARGPHFDAEGRRKAGYTESELHRLPLLGGSRGRPPRAYWFDAAHEERVTGRQPSQRSLAISADLSTLPLFLAHAEDVVIGPTPPAELLAALHQAGFAIPRFAGSLTELADHPLGGLEPWGISPALPPTGLDLREPAPAWHPAFAALSSKTQTHRHAHAAFAGQPGIAPSLGAAWTEPQAPEPGKWVIKAPFSTAGSDRIVGEGPLTPPQQAWLARTLSREGEVLYQPWYQRLADLSVHVTASEQVQLDGITTFYTTETGVYRGSYVGRFTDALTPDQRRWLYQGSPSPLQQLEAAGRAAGQWAHSLGFRGPLSLDAALISHQGQLSLHPWLETNARRTLGRVALALQPHIALGVPARFHLSRATPEAKAQLRAQLTATPAQRAHGRLTNGALATSPVEQATAVLSWLTIGEAPRLAPHPSQNA